MNTEPMAAELDRQYEDEMAEQLEFVGWLKANGIYNEFASVGAMRQMQTVWKAAMKERDTVRLKFTKNEQNCLAMVCQTMSTVHYKHNVKPDSFEADDGEAWAMQLGDIVESFPSINWGELYDKFHRQGLNS